jgi:hypothetical protein
MPLGSLGVPAELDTMRTRPGGKAVSRESHPGWYGGYTSSTLGRVWISVSPSNCRTHHAIVLVHDDRVEPFAPEGRIVYIPDVCGERNLTLRHARGTRISGRRRCGRTNAERWMRKLGRRGIGLYAEGFGGASRAVLYTLAQPRARPASGEGCEGGGGKGQEMKDED